MQLQLLFLPVSALSRCCSSVVVPAFSAAWSLALRVFCEGGTERKWVCKWVCMACCKCFSCWLRYSMNSFSSRRRVQLFFMPLYGFPRHFVRTSGERACRMRGNYLSVCRFVPIFADVNQTSLQNFAKTSHIIIQGGS